jgi:Ca-activated chloride channel family protein
MDSARQSRAASTRSGILLFGTLVAVGGPALGAGSPPLPPRPDLAVSPSKVLAQLSTHTGAMSYPTLGQNDARPDDDRSLAPYLMVAGETPVAGGVDRVPLKETSADVTIAGVIAHVQVHQVFENGGRTPIEAVYVFPASTRAAVHGVRMKIANRVIEAKIDKREAARESYETAKREGKRASLLEQERPNVFTMNVANIMPGDKIGVELDYSEMLVPENATYEFVYPTVVGPRYGGGADPVKDKWISNPHLPAGTPEPYRFDIRVHLESGIPVKELSSPSHQVQVTYASTTSADVKLAVPGGGNRDFVLRYRLAGDKIETGALLWEGEGGGGRKENFFALMMEPPRRPTAAQIPPREYIFLLDVSGSMHGFPLDTAKELMRNLLGRLRPTDFFNIVEFSGAAHVMSPEGSIAARPAEVSRAIADIERQQGGGGTELMGGLELAYKIPKRDNHVSRTVVVVTDGFVGVEAQAFRFIRERLSQANLFAFGIGSSVNRGLIEGMARAGQGEPFVVLRPEKAAEEADKLRAYIEQPVLTGIKVAFSGLDAYEVAPQALPDLLAQRPVIVFGKYRGTPSGTITVTGNGASGAVRQVVDVRPANVRAENGALRWLWARRWVETLDDERALGAGAPAEQAITALGLDYRLLTAFTSFVAVDSQVVNAGGQGHSVRQPLPMPEGVSNLAVGEGTIGVGGSGYMGALGGKGHAMQRISGSAYGAAGGVALAPPPAPVAAAPMAAAAEPRREKKSAVGKHEIADSPLEAALEEEDAAPAKAAKADTAKDKAALTWSVRLDRSAGVRDAGPLVTAIRTALAKRADLGGGTVRVRVTVDAHGKVVGLDVVGGDKGLGLRLKAALLSLSSASVSNGPANGTVELTIRGG